MGPWSCLKIDLSGEYAMECFDTRRCNSLIKFVLVAQANVSTCPGCVSPPAPRWWGSGKWLGPERHGLWYDAAGRPGQHACRWSAGCQDRQRSEGQRNRQSPDDRSRGAGLHRTAWSPHPQVPVVDRLSGRSRYLKGGRLPPPHLHTQTRGKRRAMAIVQTRFIESQSKGYP